MKPIRLLLFLLCLLVALAALPLFAQTPTPPPMPRRANIILIVADGLAAKDLSCYGQKQFQTPNLDKLAAQGILFTNYSAGGLASSAAHVASLTGKNTSYLPDANYWIPAGAVTVAQLLKNSGYYTGYVGEWDLGDQNSASAPWLEGFDDFAGYLNHEDAQNFYSGYVWHYTVQVNPLKNETKTFNQPETLMANAGGQKGEYIPDSMARWAMNFAKANQPKPYTHYRPFFLMVNFPIPGNGNVVVPTDAPYSEESWPQSEKNRAAAIARIDGYIGSMLEYLDKINQSSNTVIFFTGNTVPKKGGGIDPKFFHENAAPDDVHVPMIAYWPGKIPAGQVSSLECSAMDFLPTATYIALINPPDKIDGKSFAPALFSQKPK